MQDEVLTTAQAMTGDSSGNQPKIFPKIKRVCRNCCYFEGNPPTSGVCRLQAPFEDVLAHDWCANFCPSQAAIDLANKLAKAFDKDMKKRIDAFLEEEIVVGVDSADRDLKDDDDLAK